MAGPSLRQPQTLMRTGHGLGCMLLLALAAARPADAQPAPTWSELHGLRFAVTQGTTTCPADTVPVTHTFAQELEQATSNGLCDMIGAAGRVHLADGWAMGGRMFGCRMQTNVPGMPLSALCVTYTPPPNTRRRLPREIYPGSSGKVLEFVARDLSANATPLARVYISGPKPPAGWGRERMIWDAPTDSGSAWVPDGKQFQLHFVAERGPGDLPKLTATARPFTNKEPVPWTPCANPVIPQYVISELGKTAGMSVLSDGTLRFYVEVQPTTRSGTMLSSTAKPATFVVNSEKKVLRATYCVDDHVTDVGASGSTDR